MAIRTCSVVILLLLAAGLCDPPELSSCGPFLPQAIFAFSRAPEKAVEQYAHGRLGVLQPAFVRFYLVIAYRYLAGTGLNDAERKALFGPPPEDKNIVYAAPPDSVKQWLDARGKAPGMIAPAKIEVFKQTDKADYFSAYVNCGDDAFLNAAATLEDRKRKWGENSPELKAWVEAQDQVFANCSGGPVIPAAPAAGGDPLARADRTYQIAAATFYSGQFKAAETMFHEIADDHASPWSKIAPYLVARALIRQGTLGVKGEGVDKTVLAAAEQQLQSLLNDPSREALHPAARRLLRWVGLRLNPEKRMHELAEALVQKDSQAALAQGLIDYRYLYDQFEAGKNGAMEALPVSDDLTDWLHTFQSGGPDHAAEKWRATHSLPWLVAALAKADANHAAVPDLLAAGKVGRDSPGYASVQFEAARLLIDAKRDDEARAQLDQVLAPADGALLASSVNLLRAERMKLARSWDEFLQYAPRTAVGTYDGIGEGDLSGAELPRGVKAGEPEFDADSTKILNEQTPLGLLADAARREVLSRSMRREVAVAAWTRAVLLGDEKVSMSVAPVLQILAPELKAPLQSYIDAGDAPSRTFAAAWLMLRFPGMRPYVRTGFGRFTPAGVMDHLRDNWWCSVTPEPNSYHPDYNRLSAVLSEPLHKLYAEHGPRAQFLSLAEQESALQEWSRLEKIPAAPDYLAARAAEWAETHASDPRAPEALHLAVNGTHYGCSDGETARYSKRAFEVLHRRFPNSEWAKKTKYWY